MLDELVAGDFCAEPNASVDSGLQVTTVKAPGRNPACSKSLAMGGPETE
jgi:hypothetical protein